MMLQLNYPTSHPNVLAIDFVRFAEESSQLFFLLRCVDGGDLEQWIHDGRLYAGEETEVKRVQVRVVRVGTDG